MKDKYEKARAIFLSLSEADQAAVMREYDENVKPIKEILAAYGLTELKPAELCHVFPPLTSPDKICPYCKTVLLKYHAPRTASYARARAWQCLACGHEESGQCGCKGCREQRRIRKDNAINARRNVLRDTYSVPDKPLIELSELSLFEKAALGTMARIGLSSDCDLISPFDSQPYPVFPDSDFENVIVGMLLKNSIISIHPESDMEAFQFDAGGRCAGFVLKRISFRPNVALSGSRSDAMRALLSPASVPASEPEVQALWRTIVYAEMVDLFLYRMDAYGFQYTVGKETKVFFEEAIEALAPGELYAVIWSAAKNAAAYSVEAKVSKRQAGNSVLMRMRSSVDKVLAGQYRRIVYERPYDRPQSLLSKYVFDSLLGLCDRYWATAIGKATHE